MTARLALLVPVALATALAGVAQGAELPNETAWAAGTNWSYRANFAGLPHAWVYVPASTSPKAPGQRGAVFHLVGCGQRPFQVAQGAGWPEAAEAYGLVVVVPEIISPVYPNKQATTVACYNYGGGDLVATMPTRDSADHKALIAAAGKIVADHADLAIDPRQIYLAGLSAGGAVALEVACMAPDLFAGAATAAAPAMGSNQSTAVMPPSITAAQVKSKCQAYAQGSSAASPLERLKEHTYLLVSDNNGLPAGNAVLVNGVWTAEKFAKQTIWDGDKFCPHAYHPMNASAFAELIGLTADGAGLALADTGVGIGCPGGAASHDDTAEVECKVADAVTRTWTLRTSVWRDADGRQRLTYVEQDTLRHAWPAGPAGPLDHAVTPDRAWLKAQGYFAADGSFDMTKLATAPNGTLGAIYVNPASVDFPVLAAATWLANNPRLPAGATPGDGGVVPGDGGVVQGDAGVAQGDAGTVRADGGVARLDGGVTPGDGGVSTGDGGSDTAPGHIGGPFGCAAAGASSPTLLLALAGALVLGARARRRRR